MSRPKIAIKDMTSQQTAEALIDILDRIKDIDKKHTDRWVLGLDTSFAKQALAAFVDQVDGLEGIDPFGTTIAQSTSAII